MANRKQVHTVPDQGGLGWKNVVNGQTVSRHFRKDTATEAGRSTARQNSAEHVIHNRNGRISQSNSYGNDPCPPKDKK